MDELDEENMNMSMMMMMSEEEMKNMVRIHHLAHLMFHIVEEGRSVQA